MCYRNNTKKAGAIPIGGIFFLLMSVLLTTLSNTENAILSVTISIFAVIFCVFGTWKVVRYAYFRGNDNFNDDSLRIGLAGLVPIILLVVLMILAAMLEIDRGVLEKYVSFVAVTSTIIASFFEIIYLYRCISAEKEMKNDVPLEAVKMILIIITSVMDSFTNIFLINSCVSGNISLELCCHTLNLIVNAITPYLLLYEKTKKQINAHFKENIYFL